MIRSRFFTTLTFAGVLAAGAAGATQCQGPFNVGGVQVTCPDRPALRLPPRQVPGTATALVPGSPVGLLACRYHGAGAWQPPGSFAVSATFAPTPIATALNHATVPPPIPVGSVIHCPFDLGEVIVLRFAYANRQILNVNVSPLGCRFANNGDRGVITPQSVLTSLVATLGHERWPGDSSAPTTPHPGTPPSGPIVTP
jgi:hypothetical protein